MLNKQDLHDYQKRIVDQIHKEKSLGVFIDCGLGKTITTLTFLSEIEFKKALIVAPILVCKNVWKQEAESWRHTKRLNFHFLHGKDKKLGNNAQIDLINYEGLTWIAKEIKKQKQFPYDVLILDESLKIKSSQTKRFKAFRTLFKEFKYRILLTATPISNSLMDIWSQMFVLDNGKRLDTSFHRFKKKYFEEVRQYTWQERPGAYEKINKLVSGKAVRLKAEDYLKLPKLMTLVHKVYLNDKHYKQYKKFEKDFILEIDDVKAAALNAASLSSKLRQFTQGGIYHKEEHERYNKTLLIHNYKLEALYELIESLQSNVLIAIQFKFELDMIKSIYPNIPAIVGGMKSSDTSRLIKGFQQGKIDKLVVHPIAVAEGVNLQFNCHDAIWYNLTWSLSQYIQLNGRVNRQGQKSPFVRIHHIIAEKTIDQVVSRSLQDKDMNMKRLLNNIKEFIK